MIFTELSGEALDGLRLARDIRRSEFACRRAPIVMITAEATPKSIFGARDAGVHEFLRKPYTIRDLLRRLEALTQKRDWIEGIAYIGPDRRRFNSGDYQGPRKRKDDGAGTTDAARLLQAVKIVQAAYGALGSDPKQAYRALCAQAETIQQTAVSTGDQKLAAAAAALTGYLIQAGEAGLVSTAVAVHLRTLWSLLPEGMEAEARRDKAAA
jgi:CheY-like chemotaxis protein